MQALSFTSIKEYFSQGHERTLKAKKNIAASMVIKGLNMSIGLVLVPLTINYLNPTKYGIWITLSSVIGWFSFFDIGLGNGLRNRFAEALANEDHKLARVYVSTTYAVLLLIIGIALLLFFIINPYLNWSTILNTGYDPALQKEINLLALFVFSFFSLNFVFKLITTILTADQQPAKASLFNLIINILSLFSVIILTKTTNGSLLYIGIIFSGMPTLVFFISTFWFFNGKYKSYRPSLRFIDISKTRDLFFLGIKFFTIQIAGILLFETNNIIISQLFGPSEVTPYNIAFKYFNIIMMVFIIIITPFWSAFTEAWVKQEISWIKKIIMKLIKLWVILLAVGIIMILISTSVYKIWVGDKVIVPTFLSLLVFIWVMLNAWNGIFSHFFNGVGKVRIQLYLGVTSALLNIPLAIYFGIKIGILGILMANIIVVSFPLIIYPIQYKKIISGNSFGIWDK